MKKQIHNKPRLILNKDILRVLSTKHLAAPAAPMDSESFFFSGCPCCTST
jgi:hypothetical protein